MNTICDLRNLRPQVKLQHIQLQTDGAQNLSDLIVQQAGNARILDFVSVDRRDDHALEKLVRCLCHAVRDCGSP